MYATKLLIGFTEGLQWVPGPAFEARGHGLRSGRLSGWLAGRMTPSWPYGSTSRAVWRPGWATAWGRCWPDRALPMAFPMPSPSNSRSGAGSLAPRRCAGGRVGTALPDHEHRASREAGHHQPAKSYGRCSGEGEERDHRLGPEDPPVPVGRPEQRHAAEATWQ